MGVLLVAVEPEPSKLTERGAGPAAVDEEITAVGGVTGTTGAVAVTVVEARLVWPVASVTVNLAV